ncbi:hypothetical protein D3C81_2043320 [compost metagenome]
MKQANSPNNGETPVRLSRNALRASARAASLLRESSTVSAREHQSRWMRCISKRLLPRATGYTGISGGCG